MVANINYSTLTDWRPRGYDDRRVQPSSMEESRMARQPKESRWLYAPATAPVPDADWRVSQDAVWLRTPVLAHRDSLGSLIGRRCPDHLTARDDITPSVRRAVRKWIDSGGDYAIIEAMARKLGRDWSGLVYARRKVAIAMPDDSKRIVPATPALIAALQGLPIYKGVVTSTTRSLRARDELKILEGAWLEAGKVELAGQIAAIGRAYVRYR